MYHQIPNLKYPKTKANLLRRLTECNACTTGAALGPDIDRTRKWPFAPKASQGKWYVLLSNFILSTNM